MGTSFLAGHRVLFSEPYTKTNKFSNSSNRGIIFDVDEELSDEEICFKIGIPAKRITKKVRGENKITRQVILFFDDAIPEFIYLGWRRYRVSLYIPEPIRCYNCQAYGHKSNNCRSRVKCPICAKNHSYEDCPSKDKNRENQRAFCPNCHANHPASYKGCKKYHEAKQILKIQTEEKLSYADALKSYGEKENRSIAQAEQTKPKTVSEDNNAPGNNQTDDIITNCVNENTNSERILSTGEHINTRSDKQNHNQCVNIDRLVEFIQSIGKLLLDQNSKQDLIAKLNQMVDEFARSIKRPK